MGTHFPLVYGPGLGWACEVRAWAEPNQGLMDPWRTLVLKVIRKKTYDIFSSTYLTRAIEG